MHLTKRQIKKALALTTDADLARFFNIGRWAVGQWADNKPIPELRQLQAERKRPDVFGSYNNKQHDH